MAGTATPIFPQTVKNYVAQIANGSGTTAQALVTGGTNGTKIESLSVSNTDTSAHDVQLSLTISAVTYILATISVPASAGNIDTIPASDILRNVNWPGLSYDANGNRIFYVANGAVLNIAVLVAVASGKFVSAVASGGDF